MDNKKINIIHHENLVHYMDEANIDRTKHTDKLHYPALTNFANSGIISDSKARAYSMKQYNGGCSPEDSYDSRYKLYAIRLEFEPSDEDSKYISRKNVMSNGLIVESYGEYLKQYVTNDNLLLKLDKAKKLGYFIKTGKKYSIIDYSKSTDEKIYYSEAEELEVFGKKFVCLAPNLFYGNVNDAEIKARFEANEPQWISVEPVEWLFHKNYSVRIGKDLIFGFPNFGVESSDVYVALGNLQKEILSSEQLVELGKIKSQENDIISELNDDVRKFLIEALKFNENIGVIASKTCLSMSSYTNKDFRDLSILFCYLKKIIDEKKLFLNVEILDNLLSQKTVIETLNYYKSYLNMKSLYEFIDKKSFNTILSNIYEPYLKSMKDKGIDLSCLTINDIIVSLFSQEKISNNILEVLDFYKFDVNKLKDSILKYKKESKPLKSREEVLEEIKCIVVPEFKNDEFNTLDIVNYGNDITDYMNYCTNLFFNIFTNYSKDIEVASGLKTIVDNFKEPKKGLFARLLNKQNNLSDFVTNTNYFVTKKIEDYQSEIKLLIFLKDYIKEYVKVINKYLSNIKMKDAEIDLLSDRDVDEFTMMELVQAKEMLEYRIASYEQALMLLMQERAKVMLLLSTDYKYITKLEILKTILMPYLHMEFVINNGVEKNKETSNILESVSSFLELMIDTSTKNLQDVSEMSNLISIQPRLLTEKEREELQVEVEKLTRNDETLSLKNK